jgi:hypothetical protein
MFPKHNTKLSPQAQRKDKRGIEGLGESTVSDSPEWRRSARTRVRRRFNMNIWQYSPAKPAKGNSALQKACKRAFIAFGGPITSSTALAWWLPMAERYTTNQYISVKRALQRLGCVKIGRAKMVGRPWIWRLPVTPGVTPSGDE